MAYKKKKKRSTKKMRTGYRGLGVTKDKNGRIILDEGKPAKSKPKSQKDGIDVKRKKDKGKKSGLLTS